MYQQWNMPMLRPQNIFLGPNYNTNNQRCCPTALITCRNQFIYGLNQVRGVSGP